MTVQLRQLRYSAEIDAAKFVQGAQQVVGAANQAGTAATGMGVAVSQTDKKLNESTGSLAKLVRAIDPAAASLKRLSEGEKTLQRALDEGKIGRDEHARLMKLLEDRYDRVGQAAKNSAAAQARAAQESARGARAMDVLRDGARGMSSNLGIAGEAMSALGTRGAVAAGVLGAMAAAAGLAGAAVLSAGREFQNLQATLRTVGGSAQLAAAEFDQLKQFALEVPVSVGDATQAFIKLKALGLNPSMEALKSYGNTAGAMGKSLTDMIEAVADASTGEFERLKEFGIKASAENGKVTMNFQGTKTVIANNSTEIQKYLLAIGNTKFAGGLAEQSKTLDGALTRLSNGWSIFLDNIANSGPIQAATALINGLANAVISVNNALFPSLDAQIANTRSEVEMLRKELADMAAHPEAYGPEIEGRKAALIEREKALALLEKENSERKKLIETSKVQADVEVEVDKKAAEAAKREAERRQKVIDKLKVEWDEKTRLLDATKQSEKAVEDLNRDLEGERAVRELLGVETSKQALALTENNKALEEQANKARELARANYDLTIETKKETEAQKAAADARKKAEKEAADAQEKYVKDIQDTAEKISDDVSEKIFDGLTGKGGDIVDWFKALFKRIAVEALAANVILPITTQVVGSAPGMFGVSSPQSGTQGGGFDAGGMISNASSIYNGMSGAGGGSQMALGSGSVGSTGMMSGMTSSVNAWGASTMGFAPGTVAAAPSAAFVGPMPMAQGTSAIAGGSTMTAALGAGFAGAAAGGMVGSMIGNATESKAIGAGSGALTGAAVGFMMGGPVGAAVGAIGGALMGALGTAGKPSNKEGNATVDLATGRTVVGGQEGKKFSQENRDAAEKAAGAYGGIAGMLGGFSDRQVTGGLAVFMGNRDGMSAKFGDASKSFSRDERGMKQMTEFFVGEFAAQLGDDLPAEIRTALQHVDWSDVETALKDVNFAGNFRDAIDALRGGLGMVDQASAAAKEEVSTLTANIREFRATTARLGLDTNAANDATRGYVESLLGMRAVAPAMTETEAAVSVLRVRFEAMAPLLAEVGIAAEEAAKGFDRAVTAMRDQFLAGLEREFFEMTGEGWINQISSAFATTETRLRDAAALGAGSGEVLRNNHAAMVNIMKDLTDAQLAEAGRRFGSGIQAIADSLLAARAGGVAEAATEVADAVDAVAEAARRASDLQAAMQTIADDRLASANAAVEAARAKVQDAFQREIDIQQELAQSAAATRDEMRRLAEELKDFAQGLLTGELSNLSPEGKYTAARSQFEDLAARAAAGDASALAQLQSGAGTFLQSSRDYNASGEQYSRDFARVQQVLAAAQSSAARQASAAEQQLAAAERQTSLLQSQLQVALGTQSATLSVAQAMTALSGALAQQSAAAAAQAATASGGGGSVDIVAAAYQQYLGRAPEAAGYANWQSQLSAGVMSAGQVVDAIKNSAEAKAYGRADGGMVSGGIWNQDSMLVPLAGGEFVTRAPSVNGGTLSALQHINRTGRMPANDDGAVAELRALRDELRALVRISAAAGDENGAGLAAIEKRLATVERKTRLAGAA